MIDKSVYRFGDPGSSIAIPQFWDSVRQKPIFKNFNSLPAKGFGTAKTMKTRGVVIINYCEPQSREGPQYHLPELRGKPYARLELINETDIYKKVLNSIENLPEPKKKLRAVAQNYKSILYGK